MTLNRKNSDSLYNSALELIPGGVNSPVRAFRSVSSKPLFIAEAQGATITDADGRTYIDYVGSWGPMILGHRAPVVLEAVEKALSRGMSFGAPTDLEVEMAELLIETLEPLQMVRMVSSGTEATMSAVRLARGFTGRDKVLKFNGCYHGHADSLLVAAGSGVATFGISGSPGVPQSVAELTPSIEFNDLELFQKTIEQLGAETLAAVILEPVPGNMGLVLPDEGYLQGVRELCSKHGILLILDEVMSGFRVGLGGASERFGIQADLVTLGKVIGGGFPVGAFGGRRDIMEKLAPSGDVYQAGTLSGNPVAMAAGLATLRTLRADNPYPFLEELALRWRDGMRALGERCGVGMQATAIGSMIGSFFSGKPVRNYADACGSDTELFARFFHGMLERGFYLAPSAFEVGFLSTEHTPAMIDDTLAAAAEVLA